MYHQNVNTEHHSERFVFLPLAIEQHNTRSLFSPKETLSRSQFKSPARHPPPQTVLTATETMAEVASAAAAKRDSWKLWERTGKIDL